MSPDSKIPARSSPPPLNTNFDDSQNNDESLETFLEELFAASQRQSQEPINVRPGSRTYNTYTYTAESPRPNAATPFPGRETEIGSSPDLSSIVYRSTATIKEELPNAHAFNSRAAIFNHLTTMSELLGLSLITSDMTRLLTSRSITTSQLRDLTSDIENIISDIEGLQSPSKMPPPLFPPSSYQSPSATIKATSSVAAQNLPPPPPGGNKALQGSYTGALPLDDHTPISPFQDGDPERSDDKKTTEGADNK